MTTIVDGERMATLRQSAGRTARRVRPWWQPLALSAATTAAVAALFNPLPAFASPGGVPAVPAVPEVPAVPDIGSRPVPLGTLVLPGQNASAPATTPIATGPAVSPVVAQIERQRAEIATLGDQLIRLGQDRDLARQQLTAAETNLSTAQAAVNDAQLEADAAAADSFRDAAALPPGALGSGLLDLDQLAQIQRGNTATSESAARQLIIAQAALVTTQTAQASAAQRAQDLSNQYDTLNAQINTKQAALQQAELTHAGELSAAEATETASDRALGAEYLAGALQGRGADQRAVAALQYALNQRGKPYEWSAEGPGTFDCSGLMWAAYHSIGAGGYPLTRVARDQFWQTHNKIVDRYSLLPGDLLFFSSSQSWTGIHHVAMYAGNGMMVEAPRTGLNVRLVPVRWTRLFAATRIYGSVDGQTPGPDFNAPPASNGGTNPAPSPTPSRSSSPRPSTSPSTRPPSSSPSGTSPSTAPSSTPPSSTAPTSTAPTSSAPTSSAPTSSAPTSSAPSPTDSSSSAPSDTTSTAPADTTSTAPADTTSTAPADTTSEAPADTTSVAPADTTSEAPADSPSEATTSSAP